LRQVRATFLIEPFGSKDIPSDLQDLISRELDPHEKVVWNAMPKPRYFSGGTGGLFVLGIPWTAFSVFWIAAAAGFRMPQFNAGLDFVPLLFGIPFFLIGVLMLSAPWWAYGNQLKTVYLITDHRAITIDGIGTSTIRSYLPENLKDIFRREHPDGTGDVIISRSAWKDSEGDKHMQDLGFLRIQNAKSVETMLKALAEQCDTP
jgi:hypothetical protein